MKERLASDLHDLPIHYYAPGGPKPGRSMRGTLVDAKGTAVCPIQTSPVMIVQKHPDTGKTVIATMSGSLYEIVEHRLEGATDIDGNKLD